jgi:hypothetical protein
MKIFGIGLSRTGTLTLANALTILGLDAQHFPDDPGTQEELKAGRYDLSILREKQALTDIPVAPFYAQFDAIFPDSKFILTTRPTDSWIRSVENHFEMWVNERRTAFDDFVHACVYGTLHFSASRFEYVKQLHEENVHRYFADKPGRLLVFDMFGGDEWVTLCRFLDLPVPEVPFPHENRARTTPASPRDRDGPLRALKRLRRKPR